MNTTKYEVLLKTLELGSITRAAEALGYTQSAVSRTIAAMEREWDLPLLTRNRGGVVLSAQGAELLPYIQTLTNAQRALEIQVSELHGLTRGTLRVGVVSSVAVHWLPTIIKEFLALYPGIRFELDSKWEYAEVAELVRRGEMDCGFLDLPAHESLEAVFLRRDRLLAVLPPDHPLAGAPYYPMARFTQDPYIHILEKRDTDISRIFQEEGLHPNIQYTVNDDFAVLAMVEQGLGVSILHEPLLERSGRRFSAIPLERPRICDIGLAIRRGESISPLVRRFVDFVVQWTGAHGQPGIRQNTSDG